MPMRYLLESCIMPAVMAKVGMYGGAILMGISGALIAEIPNVPIVQTPAGSITTGSGALAIGVGGILTTILTFIAHEREATRKERREDKQYELKISALEQSNKLNERKAQVAEDKATRLAEEFERMKELQQTIPANTERVNKLEGKIEGAIDLLASRRVIVSTSVSATVLLVEDDDGNADAFATVFRSRSIGVQRVRTGPEALVLLDHIEFTACVIDLGLPGMTGAELLDEVRRTHPNLKILVLTGSTDDELLARVRGMGIAVFTKPFIFTDFLNSLVDSK